MTNFGEMLRKAKRRFSIKDKKGEYGLCESCDQRKLLFVYEDNKHELWNICSKCIDTFIEEEE